MDIRIDIFCTTFRPHFVQLLFVGGIVKVVAEDGVEYIPVRFCQIVRQVQIVGKAESRRFVLYTFFQTVDSAVTQIERFVRYQPVMALSVLVEIVDAPFGILIVELYRQEVFTP